MTFRSSLVSMALRLLKHAAIECGMGIKAFVVLRSERANLQRNLSFHAGVRNCEGLVGLFAVMDRYVRVDQRKTKQTSMQENEVIFGH